MQRRTFTAGLLLAAFSIGPVRGATARPPIPHSVLDFDWFDQQRNREVPARLYWPSNERVRGRVPLVVFSHGIGGSRRGYSYIGRHLASAGVGSLHVQHIGSDSALWRGNPFGVVVRLQAAAQEREAIERAADVRFALDRMLSTEDTSMALEVDRQRIVAAGHSYGANTTLLTIGAQVVRDGRNLTFRDHRFSAGVIISAPPFYGEKDLPGVLKSVSIPTLHVTATGDVIEIPGYRSDFEDRLAIFDATADPRKLLAVFRGGSHSMFTDRVLTGGASINQSAKQATPELILAFMDWALDGESDTLARWRTSWQAILEQPLGVPAQLQEGDDEALNGYRLHAL